MTQNINLYQPSLTAQGLLSAKVMLSVCGALALVFTILASHAFWNMWIREREIAALEVQKEDLGRVVSDLKERVLLRSEDPTLAADVKTLSRELSEKNHLLEALGQPTGSPTDGFSPILRGLARQRVAGVWLREFRITEGGQGLALVGSALAPKNVPVLLERLGEESAFAGREFKTFRLERSEDRESAIDFSLSTDVEKEES